MKPKAKALEMLGKMASGSFSAKGAKKVIPKRKRKSGRTKASKEEEQLEMRFTDEDVPILGSKGRTDKTKDDVDALQEFLDTIGGKKKLSDTQQSAYDQMMRRAFKD
mgnify:FL=1